jgi:hypothetical protein
MEKVEFLGLQNCYRIFNNTIDLIATTEIGPNIVRFGFVGERNEFSGTHQNHKSVFFSVQTQSQSNDVINSYVLPNLPKNPRVFRKNSIYLCL